MLGVDPESFSATSFSLCYPRSQALALFSSWFPTQVASHGLLRLWKPPFFPRNVSTRNYIREKEATPPLPLSGRLPHLYWDYLQEHH